MKNKKQKHYDLVYQDDSQIPFCEIPVDEEMPDKILVWEYHQTGEFEVGLGNEKVPICETDLHIYFQYKKAKEVLRPELLDELRMAFDLEPLSKATEKGKNIMKKIEENLEDAKK